jgi:hypothetical protein
MSIRIKNLKHLEEIDNSVWVTLSNGQKFRFVINGKETTIFKETERENGEIEEKLIFF